MIIVLPVADHDCGTVAATVPPPEERKIKEKMVVVVLRPQLSFILYIPPQKKSYAAFFLTWLCLVLLFHTKKLLFHINNTFDGHKKKKSVDYDWIVYPFLFFRTCVHGWTNQRVARQPTEEVAAVGSECIRASCHSIISSTTISSFLRHSYTHIPTSRDGPFVWKRGACFVCLFW